MRQSVELGFPSFEFVRALRVALDNKGTVFCYSPHENKTLNEIACQLVESNEPDAEELVSFVKSITHSTSKSAEKWEGERDMVDLWKLVKLHFYAPQTHGSNSIKYALPAIWQGPSFLDSYQLF